MKLKRKIILNTHTHTHTHVYTLQWAPSQIQSFRVFVSTFKFVSTTGNLDNSRVRM